MSTLYDILGVRQSASDEEVRKAYKRKALETHPDRLGPNASEWQRESARARFQKVREAFDVLGDSQRRKAYDTRLVKPPEKRTIQSKASDEQLRRMKERAEWVQQQRKRDEERINAMKAKDKQLKDAQDKKEREAKMTQEYLQQLYELNPEWEERRKRIHQQRTQRERVSSAQRT